MSKIYIYISCVILKRKEKGKKEKIKPSKDYFAHVYVRLIQLTFQYNTKMH
jgi:hypothetical protein